MKLVIGIGMLISMMAFVIILPEDNFDQDKSVAALEESFGKDYSTKKPKTHLKGVSAAVGEDIVKHGISKRPGEKKSRRQSKHFVCTSCHNVEREDPNLAFPTPEARLNYTIEQGLPFLQGTTLYGAVNRDSYYNGDYEKKYGDLIKPARHDIRGAIQLCAVECAQGRKLKEWEVESVLAYLWTIDLKVKDVNLTDMDKDFLEYASKSTDNYEKGLLLLDGKYTKKSEATFLAPPSDRKVGVGLTGNPNNGKRIYESSCLHCHYQKRYSFLHLDQEKLSLAHLDKKADTYSRHSIYQVSRYGTFSKYGKKSYMPRYPEERMSEQQLADLRAYLRDSAD